MKSSYSHAVIAFSMANAEFDAAGRRKSAPAGWHASHRQKYSAEVNSDSCELVPATTKASHRYAAQTQQHDAARFGHNVERDVVPQHLADASGVVGLVKQLEKQSTPEVGGGRVRCSKRASTLPCRQALVRGWWRQA